MVTFLKIIHQITQTVEEIRKVIHVYKEISAT